MRFDARIQSVSRSRMPSVLSRVDDVHVCDAAFDACFSSDVGGWRRNLHVNIYMHVMSCHVTSYHTYVTPCVI